LALAVLIVGMFMSILDVSIVNVAIPTIQKEFGTTTEDIQWIATAYSLALGVVMPLSGWLGDRLGLTRAYHLSLLGFAVGSALCGIAWDLNSMVAFRVIQAIPGESCRWSPWRWCTASCRGRQSAPRWAFTAWASCSHPRLGRRWVAISSSMWTGG
jgi:MFS family permease